MAVEDEDDDGTMSRAKDCLITNAGLTTKPAQGQVESSTTTTLVDDKKAPVGPSAGAVVDLAKGTEVAVVHRSRQGSGVGEEDEDEEKEELRKQVRELETAVAKMKGVARRHDEQRMAASSEFPLKAKTVLKLCKLAIEVLSNDGPIIRVESPVAICGNLGGDFTYLRNVLALGKKSKHDKMLVLGGFGNGDLFVICHLLLQLIRDPSSYVLLQGPHERSEATGRLAQACAESFDRWKKVWNRFNDVFEAMPLEAIVDEKIFCLCPGIQPLEDHVVVTDLDSGRVTERLYFHPRDDNDDSASDMAGTDTVLVSIYSMLAQVQTARTQRRRFRLPFLAARTPFGSREKSIVLIRGEGSPWIVPVPDKLLSPGEPLVLSIATCNKVGDVMRAVDVHADSTDDSTASVGMSVEDSDDEHSDDENSHDDDSDEDAAGGNISGEDGIELDGTNVEGTGEEESGKEGSQDDDPEGNKSDDEGSDDDGPGGRQRGRRRQSVACT